MKYLVSFAVDVHLMLSEQNAVREIVRILLFYLGIQKLIIDIADILTGFQTVVIVGQHIVSAGYIVESVSGPDMPLGQDIAYFLAGAYNAFNTVGADDFVDKALLSEPRHGSWRQLLAELASLSVELIYADYLLIQIRSSQEESR